MALYGGIDQRKGFSELAKPYLRGGNVVTAAARQAAARAGLGLDGAVTFGGAKTFSGDVTFGAGIIRTGRKMIFAISGNSKVGATSGWVITAGDNIGHAILPASQTNSTLVVSLPALQVGYLLSAVAVVGQVESAGGNVTLTMDVRKYSALAAADLTDASLGTDNVGTLVADTLLTDGNGNLKVLGLTETMDDLELLYLVLTGTTAASTDIDLMSVILTVDKY